VRVGIVHRHTSLGRRPATEPRGVEIAYPKRGLVRASDADVVLHAVADAAWERPALGISSTLSRHRPAMGRSRLLPLVKRGVLAMSTAGWRPVTATEIHASAPTRRPQACRSANLNRRLLDLHARGLTVKAKTASTRADRAGEAISCEAGGRLLEAPTGRLGMSPVAETAGGPLFSLPEYGSFCRPIYKP